jgi:hypothetical protein
MWLLAAAFAGAGAGDNSTPRFDDIAGWLASASST